MDYERNRRAAKRGAGLTRITLDQSIASPQRDVDLLALDEALDRLGNLIRSRARSSSGHTSADFRLKIPLNSSAYRQPP